MPDLVAFCGVAPGLAASRPRAALYALRASSRRHASLARPFVARFRASSAVDSETASEAKLGTSNLPYDHLALERKWQAYWERNGTFRTQAPPNLDMSKPKYYVLDMFPYPSGAGLHVGHPEGYTATDITARFKRMNGYNVLHPMGWDAFGLPAEQFALQTGTHPAVTTTRNVDRFRSQLQSLGFSYDWKREISTTDPKYYKWTQWIFLQLFEKGLAYQANVPVNWCPELGTVLANEEVIDGVSERGGYPVERRPMRQWVLKITEYADRLLEDLDTLDWPESIKEMQRNWIGRSEGAELTFRVQGSDVPITVFTTRPETICGVTYLCLAPENELLEQIVGDDYRDSIESYCAEAKRKSDRERTGNSDQRISKSGVYTGAMAVNPVSGKRVPIWVADYVLGGYGSGAVMGVPAHDSRDHDFAKTFGLPIQQVIAGDDGVDAQSGAFEGKGRMCNWNGSAGIDLDGMDSAEARDKLLDHLEASNLGTRKVNFKLRDWLFSRQRYWGEPFPIVFSDDGEAQAVPEDQLPVMLPEVSSYQPSGTGASPLANVEDWVNTLEAGTGKPAKRETNTMPQWAGSCWYYLRFIDPDNVGAPIDPSLEQYWMPVDLYVGGVEHAVLHLLYARFWHKVLYDCGIVSTKEPFQRLVNQGMILGEMEYSAFQRVDSEEFVSAEAVDSATGRTLDGGCPTVQVPVNSSAVTKKGDHVVLADNTSVRVLARAHKMSKSRGNVVNPDSVVNDYSGDALRCYLMFMGPLEQVKPWSTQGTQGMARFLGRVWRLVVDPVTGRILDTVTDDKATKSQYKTLHQTIKRVTDDTEGLRFNTAISAMMEFVNSATKWDDRPRDVLLSFARILSPYAPHISEELWELLGGEGSVALSEWPAVDESALKDDSKLIVVQINGKVRAKVTVDAGADKDEVMKAALEQPKVQKFVEGKSIRKEIYVPDKLVNLVVS